MHTLFIALEFNADLLEFVFVFFVHVQSQALSAVAQTFT
jgi:hypothetical protein